MWQILTYLQTISEYLETTSNILSTLSQTNNIFNETGNDNKTYISHYYTNNQYIVQ